MFLKAENISYTFMPNTPMAAEALSEVSFNVEEGDCYGIIGSSGSGKSTLLQILAGLLKPDKGVIYRNEKDFTVPDSLKKNRYNTGIVFQNPEQQLFADTVYEDVAYGPANMGLKREEIEERVFDALNLVGLNYYTIKDKSPFEISGGEKRKVAIAGTLAMQPELLLLDEPTAGLDPSGKKEFLSYIAKLHQKKNITILTVSHSMDEIALFAGKVLVLHRGKVVKDGATKEVFSDSALLNTIGLSLPAVTSFMQILRSKGRKVNTGVFTIEDACTEILKSSGLEVTS